MGRIALLSTHIVSDVEAVCDRVIVLHEGTVKFHGTLAELAAEAQSRVWEANVPEKEAEALYAGRQVIAGSRHDDGMRVRMLADEQPCPGAMLAEPTLEDGYVVVLRGGRS